MAKCRRHGELTLEIKKANGRCKLCHRESANSKRNNNREWFNEKIAEDKVKNPEKWKAQYKRDYQNRINAHGHEIRNTREISRRRGMSREEYEALFIEQSNKCTICKQEETRQRDGVVLRLTLDHCHATGKNRQLLCHNCNTGLGKFRENIDIMKRAIEYLRKHA